LQRNTRRLLTIVNTVKTIALDTHQEQTAWIVNSSR
jgi:hypothetical protein